MGIFSLVAKLVPKAVALIKTAVVGKVITTSAKTIQTAATLDKVYTGGLLASPVQKIATRAIGTTTFAASVYLAGGGSTSAKDIASASLSPLGYVAGKTITILNKTGEVASDVYQSGSEKYQSLPGWAQDATKYTLIAIGSTVAGGIIYNIIKKDSKSNAVPLEQTTSAPPGQPQTTPDSTVSTSPTEIIQNFYMSGIPTEPTAPVQGSNIIETPGETTQSTTTKAPKKAKTTTKKKTTKKHKYKSRKKVKSKKTGRYYWKYKY